MRRSVLIGLGLAALGPPALADCDGEPPVEALAPGLWWIRAAVGDADATNRGLVSNLLLVADGPRLWLIGSGPSPAFGHTLACAVRARWSREVTDIVSPRAHPEAVLGLAAWPRARWWAHADVAAAMRERCPVCVPRLRQRLGVAASDLGDDPVRVPTLLFDGDEGRLGPFRWRRLSRGAGFPVTVWLHLASGLAFAPGLLWAGSAPDGRDADLTALAQASADLAAVGASRWLGEQGAPMDAGAPMRHAVYWKALFAAVAAGLDRGEDGQRVPLALPGVAAEVTGSPLHALNWQRAWRQLESRWLQRSLR